MTKRRHALNEMKMDEKEAAKTPQEKSVLKEALPQILAVCVKNTLLLGFGMSLGFPTILIPGVSGGDENEDIIMNPEAISWISSINLICVPLGCTASGIITHAIGRRRSMQMVNIPFLAAWLLFYFSDEVWQIFLASCMTGLSGGLLEAPVLTYVAEITQPHLRGILSCTSTLAVVLGVLSQFLLGTFNTWRRVALINCSVPVASFVLLTFVPETPVWLITKDRFDDAKLSIAWLRGWTTTENVEEEYQELRKQIQSAQSRGNERNSGWVRQFGGRSFLWPYGVVTVAFFLSHFNGNTPMQVYAIRLFKVLRAPISEYHSTVLMGAVQLIGCVLCVSLINTVGKRVINLVSLTGAAICFLVVGTYAHAHAIIDLDPAEAVGEGHHWVPLTFLVVSSFLSYLGLKILPWILIGEVFHTEIRATASGLSAGIGYVFGFVANKVFLGLVREVSLPVVFWMYGAIGLVGAVVMYFILPETEGKTLFEITEHFAGRGRLRNSVRRKKKGVSGKSNAAFEPDDKYCNVESRL